MVYCQGNTSQNRLITEILAAKVKERKTTIEGVQQRVPKTLKTLRSLALKEDSRGLYNLESTGRSLPKILVRKNIERTQTDGLANLLALQFIRETPVELFVRGKRQ